MKTLVIASAIALLTACSSMGTMNTSGYSTGYSASGGMDPTQADTRGYYEENERIFHSWIN
ncbi:hypothetical protein [Noviherbaspirillum cavernae]|uniref:hypothetical protein n=1 Tax=Noviherbaspirillum cavernae TaxID=2320862 RepID=UPI000E6C3BC1|nr:hypothetical protein [Noviherbaspirillum cavernae]